MHVAALGQTETGVPDLTLPGMFVDTLPETDCGCGVKVPFGAICPYCDPTTGLIDPSTIRGSYFESVGQTSKQVCPMGDPSDDPLIPGVCNTSALVGATVLLGLLMVMGR